MDNKVLAIFFINIWLMFGANNVSGVPTYSLKVVQKSFTDAPYQFGRTLKKIGIHPTYIPSNDKLLNTVCTIDEVKFQGVTDFAMVVYTVAMTTTASTIPYFNDITNSNNKNNQDDNSAGFFFKNLFNVINFLYNIRDIMKILQTQIEVLPHRLVSDPKIRLYCFLANDLATLYKNKMFNWTDVINQIITLSKQEAQALLTHQPPTNLENGGQNEDNKVETGKTEPNVKKEGTKEDSEHKEEDSDIKIK